MTASTTTQAGSAIVERVEGVVAHPVARFAALGVVGWSIWSADDAGPVLCPFRRCTGGYCPGCGATRGASRLLRGDVAGSWAQHPIVMLIAVQAVLAGAYFGVRSDQRTEWRTVLRPVFAMNLIALLAIWVVRLATAAVPVPFT